MIASAFRGISWISGVQPQPVAHCVCTPHDGRTKPWFLELRNSYERSFESPEGVREPSGGLRLATAVVVRHGRCKASSRQWVFWQQRATHRRRQPILRVHPIGSGEDPGKNHSSGSAPNGSLSEKAPLEHGFKGA